jgi:drug/metabolite transporter (DMT)-like permease
MDSPCALRKVKSRDRKTPCHDTLFGLDSCLNLAYGVTTMSAQRLFFLATPALFVLIWSTGWIAARYAAPFSDPLWYLTIRFFLAGLVLALFAMAVRAPWPLGRRAWMHALVSGVLLHGIYLAGVWWAVKHGLSAGLSGLLAALQPLASVFLGPWLLREQVGWRQYLGVALGLLGVVAVLSPRLVTSLEPGNPVLWVPLAVNILGVMTLTAGSFYQKRYLAGGDLRTVTSVQYLGALLFVAPLALLTEDLRFDLRFETFAVMIWSVLVLSIFSIALMLMMINRGEVTRVSALIYLVPTTVAIQAWLMFGETLVTVQVLGMVLTAAGVYLSTKKG